MSMSRELELIARVLRDLRKRATTDERASAIDDATYLIAMALDQGVGVEFILTARPSSE